MDRDLSVYAAYLIDKMCRIKDRHRDILTFDEVDTINDICNLLDHNRGELKRE